MGNAERRFKDCVSRGDEDKANDFYFTQFKNNSKKRIDPNSTVARPTTSRATTLGAPLTLLQCCALHAMERLYWSLLSNGGDLDSVTSEGESICHLICSCEQSNVRKSDVRLRMLTGTLEKCHSLSQLMTRIDAKDHVSSLMYLWYLYDVIVYALNLFVIT